MLVEDELAFFSTQEKKIEAARSELTKMADEVCKKDISIYDNLKCPVCKGTNFGYSCIQRRSMDESMCTRISCRRCSYSVILR
jgi:DNA-directed RNA polymerase subunit M/transcription elongation factor TFIIS